MPGERLAAIGCGAALQHARLDLAANGWRVTVTRQPDDADPRHLARLRIDAVGTVPRQAADAAQNVPLRHTDPGPVTGGPLRPQQLNVLRAAVESEGGHLHVLRPDEILRLVLASAPAGDVEPVEAQWYGELARWAGRDRLVRAEGKLSLPRQTDRRHRAATFAVLYGPGDEPLNWLRAGEALSTAWLAATEMQVSVLPFSAPIERPAARDALRRIFHGRGHPYLVMRLGRHAAAPVAPPRTRLPVDRIVEVQLAGWVRPAQ